MYFIDSHTHLFAEEFNLDSDEVINRALSSQVKYMLLPNIDISSIDDLKLLHKKFPASCLPMMGLHPSSVNEDYKEVLKQIEKELFSDYKYYGVGEIGLDLYWDKSTLPYQLDAFEIQCNWASELNLGVSIHSRSATYEALRVLKGLKRIPKGVFHCFSGSYEEAKEIIGIQMFLGIGGVLTFKNSNLPEVLKKVSLNNIVLETDSPYLSPVPFRGKRNESAYIPYIAEKLAFIYNVTVEEVAEVTSANAKAAFGF